MGLDQAPSEPIVNFLVQRIIKTLSKFPICMKTVPINSLVRWGSTDDDNDSGYDDDFGHMLNSDNDKVEFSMNEELNWKIILWQGNITQIGVDAIVNCANETLNDHTGVSGLIHDCAGAELEQECLKLKHCRPGESKITSSGQIRTNGGASYVIHAVPPEWSPESEITLAKAYKSALEVAKKRGITSIVFSVLKRKGYPRERAAHIALRTVRKSLESMGASLSSVIFAFQPTDVYDQMIYESVLPLYFPRNAEELQKQSTTFEELKTQWKADVVATTAEIQPNQSQLTAAPTLSHEEGIESFVQRCKNTDLSDIAALELIYLAGEDALGRPTYIFMESHLPNRKMDLERVLMYLIKILDPVVDAEYVLIYINRQSSAEYLPEFSWLKRVYGLFDRRFKKNLKQLYIVHPTFWLKTALQFLRPFISSKFYAKIHYLNKLADIFPHFPQGKVKLPDCVCTRKYLEGTPIPQFDMPEEEPVYELEKPTQEIVALDLKLGQARAAKETLVKQLIQLADQLALTEQEKELLIRQFTEDRNQWHQEKSNLESELQARDVDKEHAELSKDALSHLQAQIEMLEEERRRMLIDLRDLSNQLEQSMTYNQIMQQELDQEAQEIRDGRIVLIQRLESLSADVDASHVQLRIMTDELAAMEATNTNMKETFAKTIGDLETQVEDAKVRAQTYIDNAQTAKDAVFAKVNSLLGNANADKEALEEQLNAMREERDKLLEMIAHLREKLEQGKQEAKASRASGFQDALKRVEDMVDTAEQDVSTIESHLRPSEDDENVDDRLQEEELMGTKGDFESMLIHYRSELRKSTLLNCLNHLSERRVSIGWHTWQRSTKALEVEEQAQITAKYIDQLRKDKTTLGTKVQGMEADLESATTEKQRMSIKYQALVKKINGDASGASSAIGDEDQLELKATIAQLVEENENLKYKVVSKDRQLESLSQVESGHASVASSESNASLYNDLQRANARIVELKRELRVSSSSSSYSKELHRVEEILARVEQERDEAQAKLKELTPQCE